MGRFYATNSHERHQTAKNINKKSDLDISKEYSNESVFVTTYQKRAVNNKNFLSTDNGFIASTGTLIYDGKMGYSSLSKIDEKGISNIDRSQFIGHYCLLTKAGDELSIFTDPKGGYEVFFAAADDWWFVSNSLMLVASVLNEKKIDRLNLIENSFYIKNISDNTFYKEVNQLVGTKKIKINTEDGSLSIKNIGYPERDWNYEGMSFEDTLSDYTSRVTSVFSQIREATESIGIQATGGLDSRTILSALLDQSLAPLLLYGVGNSKLTNTKREDLRAVEEYADKFDLDFYQMNWKSECPHEEKTLSTLFEKYGFRMAVYGASPNLFDEYEENLNPNPTLVMSGYSPAFTNLAPWEMRSEYPSDFQDFIENHIAGTYKDFSNEGFTCSEDYLDNLLHNAERMVKQDYHNNVNLDDSLDFKEFINLKLYFKQRGENINFNVMNEFHYHLCPFYTYHLNDPLKDVPSDYRSGDVFRVKLIKNLYPSVLEIPIFTGVQPAKINDNNDSIIENPVHHPLTSTSTQLISLGSRLPDSIKKTVKPAYALLRNYGMFSDPDNSPSCNSHLEAYYANKFNDHPIIERCIDINDYTGDLRGISRLCLLTYGIDQIGYQVID